VFAYAFPAPITLHLVRFLARPRMTVVSDLSTHSLRRLVRIKAIRLLQLLNQLDIASLCIGGLRAGVNLLLPCLLLGLAFEVEHAFRGLSVGSL
jgi:hypothetical protein